MWMIKVCLCCFVVEEDDVKYRRSVRFLFIFNFRGKWNGGIVLVGIIWFEC